MKVLLLGGSGQLGSDLRSSFAAEGIETISPTHTEVDIRDEPALRHAIETVRPQVVINATAYHRLEDCEESPATAFEVNSTAVRNLALICQEHSARLIHFSTDYVFDGRSRTPYAEDATVNPLNTYGVSKVAGESFVRNACADHLIVRTSGLYGVAGSSGKGGNFVETMLRLARERGTVSVVTDQVLSPTYTADLASATAYLITTEACGTFHVTNSGACTWYEFAAAIFELSNLEVYLRSTTSAEFGSTVVRPNYSVLDNANLRTLRYQMRPWREALMAYLEASHPKTL